MAALSHPNILAIFDVGSDQGISFAVLELLEGACSVRETAQWSALCKGKVVLLA